MHPHLFPIFYLTTYIPSTTATMPTTPNETRRVVQGKHLLYPYEAQLSYEGNHLLYEAPLERAPAINQPEFFPVQLPNASVPFPGISYARAVTPISSPAYERFFADSSFLDQLSHDHFITANNECLICTENDAQGTVQTQCKHV